jgi:hypothetical protein
MTRLIRMRFSHISIRYPASVHYQHDHNSQAARTERNVPHRENCQCTATVVALPQQRPQEDAFSWLSLPKQSLVTAKCEQLPLPVYTNRFQLRCRWPPRVATNHHYGKDEQHGHNRGFPLHRLQGGRDIHGRLQHTSFSTGENP